MAVVMATSGWDGGHIHTGPPMNHCITHAVVMVKAVDQSGHGRKDVFTRGWAVVSYQQSLPDPDYTRVVIILDRGYGPVSPATKHTAHSRRLVARKNSCSALYLLRPRRVVATVFSKFIGEIINLPLLTGREVRRSSRCKH